MNDYDDRKKKMGWIAPVLAVLVTTIAVVLVVSGGSSDAARNAVLVGVENEVQKLDPHQIKDIESGQVCDMIYEGLVAFADGPDALMREVQPALAVSWEVTEEGRVYTFALRPGVTFHDGAALDAEAVKRSFDRLRQVAPTYLGNGFSAPYGEYYQDITTVDVVDAMTVRFVLSAPSAVFLGNLAMTSGSVVSPQALAALAGWEEDSSKVLATTGTGTGAWELADAEHWKRGQTMTLSRNDAYWGAAPTPERVVFMVMAAPEQRVNALMSGLVHIISNVPPERIASLRTTTGVRVVTEKVPNVCYVALNPNPRIPVLHGQGEMRDNPIAPAWVREAITLAIDRAKIVTNVYRGNAIPARSLLPPSILGYPADFEGRPSTTEANLAAARALVSAQTDAEGTPYGPDNMFPVTLRHMGEGRSYVPNPAALALSIQHDLREAWIDLTLWEAPWTSYSVDMQTGAYEMFIIGWQTDNGDPDNFHGALLGADANGVAVMMNSPKWSDPAYQELISRAKAYVGGNEGRAELYREAERMMREAHVLFPLTHSEIAWAVADDVEGFRVHPMGRMIFERVTRATAE